MNQKQSYRVFLRVECGLLVVAILGCAGVASHHVGKWVALPLGILWGWHFVVIPIAFLYLIGKPVVMNLSPLVSSAESKAFQRLLRDRPVLDDEEFYARYYEGSNIPKHIPACLRRWLVDQVTLAERLIPSDFLYLLDDELDFDPMFKIIEREFRVRFTQADFNDMDGTLDHVIRLIFKRIINPARKKI